MDAITIAACGTSFYAASVARYWIEDLVGIPCNVEIASEFRYRKSAVLPNSLVCDDKPIWRDRGYFSSSKAFQGNRFFCDVNDLPCPTSSMVRESDLSLLLQIGSEIGVASTKAFSAELVNLLLLAILIGRRKGLTQEKRKRARRDHPFTSSPIVGGFSN